MGYLALYRKYRPVDFNSVYGQEEVVTVIKNAIVSGKVSHAYLFCGPRGTGKTTIAKIIARLVNCENLVDGNPCGKCYNCLNYLNSNDIVEIDAASNNGVDEIRELRDKINLVPSNSKYKVYIIDEVHNSQFMRNVMQRHFPNVLHHSVHVDHAVFVGLYHPHIASGEVGKQHAERDRYEQQRFILFFDTQIKQYERNGIHDQKLRFSNDVAERSHLI